MSKCRTLPSGYSGRCVQWRALKGSITFRRRALLADQQAIQQNGQNSTHTGFKPKKPRTNVPSYRVSYPIKSQHFPRTFARETAIETMRSMNECDTSSTSVPIPSGSWFYFKMVALSTTKHSTANKKQPLFDGRALSRGTRSTAQERFCEGQLFFSFKGGE